jgi:hypothetical protein
MLKIEGQKFGKWTVIRKTEKRKLHSGKPRVVIWECRCDCGTIREVPWTVLKNKLKPRSCGCSRKEGAKQLFEANYQKTPGCWEWKGTIGTGGYGKFGSNGLAHRRAYAYIYGEIPKGMQVCHKCDNRKCVNPAHLFLGSCADNLRDMTQKGRRARGNRIASSLLDEKKVLEIRKKRMAGAEYQSLSEEFGVGWYTIRSICKNNCWKHVQLGEECKNYLSPAARLPV